MRPAKVEGSNSEKPEVSNDVSNKSHTRSLTVLSEGSASNLLRNSLMMGCLAFTSIVFFETMYDDMESSRRAWARMIRSIFELHPCSDVVKQQGLSTMRSLICT